MGGEGEPRDCAKAEKGQKNADGELLFGVHYIKKDTKI